MVRRQRQKQCAQSAALQSIKTKKGKPIARGVLKTKRQTARTERPSTTVTSGRQCHDLHALQRDCEGPFQRHKALCTKLLASLET